MTLAPPTPAAPAPEAPAPADERPTQAPAAPQAPRTPAVGADRARVDAPLKVTGTAPYAYEHEVDNHCYVWPVISTIARGRITAIDTTLAAAAPGVIGVLTHENAPALRIKADANLWILQNDTVHYRGQIIAGVLAETPEAAREAAESIAVSYAEEDAEVEFDPDDPQVSTAKLVMMRPASSSEGDVDAGMAQARYRVEESYSHPAQYHVQMEPHTAVAIWHETSRLDLRATRLTIYDANQGPLIHTPLLSSLFGVPPNQIEIISPYVGGGFGGKAMPHPPLVLAILAAKTVVGRPVKLAIPRQHSFAHVGHRAQSEQRMRLGADDKGRLTALEQVSIQATARVKKEIDQSAFAARVMYAAPNRHTEHRYVQLDRPPGTWMRAPGEFTGMYALETAMDELAHACGLDPIELRRRNEPEVDPENGKPWSTRNLLACLDRGAELFGWSQRQAPGQRVEGEWRIGLGMASSYFPNTHMGSMFSRITYTGGRYLIQMQASDIGTGAHTVLPQIAADELGVDVDLVQTDIGRTGTPLAMVAGGSAGTYEWGNAIVAACRKFRRKHGDSPAEGATALAQGRPPKGASKYSRQAFGATFAEVAASAVTGEVRVRRLTGVYAAGTIVNPRTARSQMIGGMTMALSATLHEESYRDPRFGHIVNGDLAGYHIAAHADIPPMEVEFLREFDPWFGAIGSKGIGEMAMTGTPAAIGNALFNATGRRLRELPFTPDKVLTGE